jgi:plastocyanin
MHFSTISFLTAATVASAATTISVAVGQGGLIYTPNDIKASVGDSVEFSFFPKVLPISLAFTSTILTTFRITP